MAKRKDAGIKAKNGGLASFLATDSMLHPYILFFARQKKKHGGNIQTNNTPHSSQPAGV